MIGKNASGNSICGMTLSRALWPELLIYMFDEVNNSNLYLLKQSSKAIACISCCTLTPIVTTLNYSVDSIHIHDRQLFLPTSKVSWRDIEEGTHFSPIIAVWSNCGWNILCSITWNSRRYVCKVLVMLIELRDDKQKNTQSCNIREGGVNRYFFLPAIVSKRNEISPNQKYRRGVKPEHFCYRRFFCRSEG